MSYGIEITMIEQRGEVEKVKGGYQMPITYVLANGQRVTTVATRRLKRDVLALAGVPAHPMSAQFNDVHLFIGTKTSFYIGPSR